MDPSRGRLGPGLVARGRLTGRGTLVIEGRVEGEVDLDGRYELAATGESFGPVRAREVVVAGELRGAVDAGAVLVQVGGRLVGDVRAAEVGIDDGGALHGAVDMAVDLDGAGLDGVGEGA